MQYSEKQIRYDVQQEIKRKTEEQMRLEPTRMQPLVMDPVMTKAMVELCTFVIMTLMKRYVRYWLDDRKNDPADLR